MHFEVLLTKDAVMDFESIYDYIAIHDTKEQAEYVAAQINKVFMTLLKSPKRGSYLKELLEIGIREYREIFYKPYRIIYRIIDDTVYVMMIVDGRRNMQSLLERRLIEG